MAIYRANQAGDNTFVIVVYTVALKKMVRYGLNELGLDKDRVVHEWSWINRGIEISGDVFCFGNRKKVELCDTSSCECKCRPYSCVDSNILILKEDNGKIRYFAHCAIGSESNKSEAGIYRGIINTGKYLNYTVKQVENPLEVSIDFDDWIHDRFYYNFYRRTRWFREIELTNFNFDLNADNIVFIPAGYLFKEKGIVNYIIVDEGQDFALSNYDQSFIPQAQKSISIFGDSHQRIYIDRYCDIEDIAEKFKYPLLNLNYNYRIPKTIAKIAQKIPHPHLDLLTNNRKNNGNSDYPSFPKPIIKKCNSEKEELQYILNRIQTEGMDDVAILVTKEELVIEIYDFFKQHQTGVQVRITIDIGVTPFGNRKFHRIDTLDFTNHDLPCILTYHSAKGTEFDNVFIPFADNENPLSRNPFYVAVTRSSSRVFITYSRTLTSLLSNINKDDVIYQ
jgi:hypothetical protein